MDFPDLRTRDPSLAQAWRLATREAFTRYFARGYRAVDFILRQGERLQGDYVLTRGTDED